MTLDFSHYLLIIVGAVLVNNVVLVRILGLCPFMGVSKKLDAAIGMGAATAFVLTLASGASHLLNLLLLAAGLEYLRTIAFIVVIAAIVQFTEMVIHKTSPVLYQALGIYLPLITTNCASAKLWPCWALSSGTPSTATALLRRCCSAWAARWAFRWCWCCLPRCASGWKALMCRRRFAARRLRW